MSSRQYMQWFIEVAPTVFSSVLTCSLAAAVGLLFSLEKRSSVVEARIGLVLEQITALRGDHKERLDDHEFRLRTLERLMK